MYNKLSGMTGTAKTEEDEFREIYNMDVVVIPTNKEVIREDFPDAVFTTEKGKYKAIVDRVVQAHELGQPVLVGTISIEKSELIADMLKKRGIKNFNVLNAKQHEKEAAIVAEAGRKGAVPGHAVSPLCPEGKGHSGGRGRRGRAAYHAGMLPAGQAAR